MCVFVYMCDGECLSVCGVCCVCVWRCVVVCGGVWCVLCCVFLVVCV